VPLAAAVVAARALPVRAEHQVAAEVVAEVAEAAVEVVEVAADEPGNN
jgi:hypothetical protein